MPDWSDKIAARRAGTVPGFVGQNTSLVGGPRHIDGVGLEGTSAQRAALDPSLYTGLYNETDTGQIWRSDGAAWSQFGTYASLDAAKKVPLKNVPVLARAKDVLYESTPVYSGDSHTGCSTNGTSTYSDPSITTAYIGRLVTGTNVPANAIVASVVAGVSFTVNVGLSKAVVATGSGSGLTFTFAPSPDKALTTIVAANIMPDQLQPGKTWSSGSSDATRVYPTYDNGGTLFSASQPQVSQTAPATTVTAVMPLPDGTCLYAASDLQSITVPSTKTLLYRSTDGAHENRSASVVATLADDGGYVAGFSFDCNTAGDFLVSTYGYKQDASSVSPNLNGRHVYACNDGGNTWYLTLDIGSYHNQHCHTPYVAPDGTGWVTTGDGDNIGLDTDALTDPNRRAVWYSPNKAARIAGTWTPLILLDPDDSTFRLQAVAVAQYRAADGKTWMYFGEDSVVRGRIYRVDLADVQAGQATPLVEVVYDPSPGVANNALLPQTGNNWCAPWYGFGVDPATNVLYCASRTEQTYNRGRMMMSPDGINFVELWENGLVGDGPGASKWAFSGDYAWYGARRFVRRQPIRLAGHAKRDLVAFPLRKDGTLATQADQWVLSAAVLGFSFRVVRFALHVRVPGSSAVSVTGRKGSGGTSICRAGSDPSVANGATGTALTSGGTILPGPQQYFHAALGDELHIDLTAAGGGTDANVYVIVERINSVPVVTNF